MISQKSRLLKPAQGAEKPQKFKAVNQGAAK
jgi:hypothetical protein